MGADMPIEYAIEACLRVGLDMAIEACWRVGLDMQSRQISVGVDTPIEVCMRVGADMQLRQKRGGHRYANREVLACGRRYGNRGR